MKIEGGMGWMGTGNVLEKALDQASGGLVGKLKTWSMHRSLLGPALWATA